MFRRLIRRLAAVTVLLALGTAAPLAAARPAAEREEARTPLSRTVLELFASWLLLAVPSTRDGDTQKNTGEGGPAIDPNGWTIGVVDPAPNDADGGPAIDPNG